MRAAAATAAVGGLLMILSLFLTWDRPTYNLATGTSVSELTGLDLIDIYVDNRDSASFLSKFDPRFQASETYASATIETERGGGFVVTITLLLGALAVLLALFTLRRSVGKRFWVFASAISGLGLGWLVYFLLWSSKNLADRQIGAILAMLGCIVVLAAAAATAMLARRVAVDPG